MPTLDLNTCFPEGKDGARGPLPKQQAFLSAALLDLGLGGPKYIRYCGGIGSGKTLIGCITVLHWAVLRPGDYLIGRQHYPELKDTTYKTFLEICPPELIVEHRVAELTVKIRTVSGGVSTILFRPLEDYDKLRSLNLCGFYIDEANQVAEAAFLLLQGRLRGKFWRKGIITMNPGGHDWSWRWFVRQDHIASPEVRRLFLNIRAPSTENTHLPEGYVETLLAAWSPERIKREIEGSDDSFEGQIYSEFDRSKHVVQPFRIPDDWTIRIGCDHGFRNPAAWIYTAISPDGDVYVFDEFYEREWLIEEIAKKGHKDKASGEYKPSAVAKLGTRKVEQARMDPSVRATRGQNGKSDWDAYTENLPSGFPLLLANNQVSQGIDRVKSYLKLDTRGRPRLFIFSTCEHLIDEISSYRWAERTAQMAGKANEKEEPVKHNDHAVDALRYVIMTCPEPTAKAADPTAALKYGTLERALYDDVTRMKRGVKSSDPFGG